MYETRVRPTLSSQLVSEPIGRAGSKGNATPVTGRRLRGRTGKRARVGIDYWGNAV